MTKTGANKLAQQGYNRIPIVLETFADLDTPLSIYLNWPTGPIRIYWNRSKVENVSVDSHSLVYRQQHGLKPAAIRVTTIVDGKSETSLVDDTLVFVEDPSTLKQFKAAPCPAGKSRFCGRRALAIDEASFGSAHNVGRNLNNLAGLLLATNRLTEAEPLMRRALAIDEVCFGAEHPDALLPNLQEPAWTAIRLST